MPEDSPADKNGDLNKFFLLSLYSRSHNKSNDAKKGGWTENEQNKKLEEASKTFRLIIPQSIRLAKPKQ